jgi:multiple sugar transport system permease protein
MRSPDWRRVTPMIVRYGLLVIASIIALFPVFWMISTSLRPSSELFDVPPHLLPKTFSLQGFANVLFATPTPRYILNSLIVVFASTTIGLTFASLSAYGLSRFEFRGKGSFLTFLLITQMFPAIMLLIPYFQIVKSLGLYNSYGALVITYTAFSVPFCTWMLYGYMRSIPTELDEAALIDGASRFGTFWRVVLPLARPGLIATAIFSFISGWNEYLYALALIQTDALKTFPVGIGLLAGNDTLDWNAIMAGSVVGSMPMLVIFIFFQRYLVGGLTAGSVKG